MLTFYGDSKVHDVDILGTMPQCFFILFYQHGLMHFIPKKAQTCSYFWIPGYLGFLYSFHLSPKVPPLTVEVQMA